LYRIYLFIYCTSVIWPENQGGQVKGNDEMELFMDSKTDLVMALKELPLLPVSAAASLMENLQSVCFSRNRS
jgi:hypothetical protein